LAINLNLGKYGVWKSLERINLRWDLNGDMRKDGREYWGGHKKEMTQKVGILGLAIAMVYRGRKHVSWKKKAENFIIYKKVIILNNLVFK
jgi:hypothetical protein